MMKLYRYMFESFILNGFAVDQHLQPGPEPPAGLSYGVLGEACKDSTML